jgi:hypothetical protein
MRFSPTRSRDYLSLFPLALALAAALLAACSSGGPADDTCQSAPAEKAVSDSSAAMARVERFRFKLTHDTGSTAVGGGLTDRLQLKAEADFGRVFVKVEAIVIEGQTWMTNPLTGNWSELAPEDSPFGFLDPPTFVANILGEVVDVCYFESDQSKSGPIVVQGKAASEQFATLVGVVEPGSTLDVTMWLDRDTDTLVKTRITGKLQPEDDESYVRVIELSDFDASIAIEPPL